MNLLLDTNIFLEIILDQEQAQSARKLLENPDEYDLFITDYSLHSIGLILFRRKLYDVLDKFVHDMIVTLAIEVISLSAKDFTKIIDAARQFNLDFDDAYQYATVEKYELTLVSFDSDFDRTTHKRKTPSDLLE